MPAQPLRIGNAGECQLIRIAKESLGFAVEQSELTLELVVTMAWQSLFEVFDHRAQTANDLEIVRSASSDLAECQIDEVFPIRRPAYHAQSSRSIQDFI